jgi:L-alanine-DL-glutamate epimerase-like enolase superfamily enzyme
MKIVDLETIRLTVPLDEPVVTSFGSMDSRSSLLIRISTDEGLVGLGEAWANFPAWGAEDKALIINHGIKPLLLGKDPRAVNAIWEMMHQALMVSYGGKQLGAPGPIHQAISGVDIALWDIWGQATKLPVYALLGGPVRSRIRAYASGLGPSNFIGHVKQALQSGYEMFKLKVGFGLKKDLQNLTAIRDAIGPEAQLLLDANQAWRDAKESLRHLRQYQPYAPECIEEPVPADQLEEMTELRRQTDLSVAGGENLYGLGQFQKALSAKALDLWQPDITKTGGFTPCRLICGLAAAESIAWAPHMFGSGVGLAASLHLLFGLPGGAFMEVDANPNPLQTKLMDWTFFAFDNGEFTISTEAPGLGISLNQSMVDQYGVKIFASSSNSTLAD